MSAVSSPVPLNANPEPSPWLRRSFWPAKFLFLLATAAAVWLFWHDLNAGRITLPPADGNAFVWATFLFADASRYLLLWLLFSLPAFGLAVWRRGGKIPVPGLSVGAVVIASLAVSGDIARNWGTMTADAYGEQPATFAYLGKLALIAGVILSAPFLIWLYRKISIMERYIVNNVLVPYLFCLFGLVSIMVIMDMANNFNDFVAAKMGLGPILLFYIVISPQMFVQIMAPALLLSTLYSISRMSRSNELISMLGAGRSLFFVLRAVFFIGLYTSLVCLAMNYSWAPRSEGLKDAILNANDDISGGVKAQNVFYHEPESNRTWFVSRVPTDFPSDPKEKLREVDIREQDSEGNLLRGWRCRRVGWNAAAHTWILMDGVSITYPKPKGLPVLNAIPSLQNGSQKVGIEFSDWPETPWKIFSGSLNPEALGVPELVSYVRSKSTATNELAVAPFRAQLSYRFSVPFTSFIVCLIAAPMGVAYSRRGALGGIAIALLLFFSLLFLDSFFLSLGKNFRISPYLSVWIPLMLFGLVGLILFWFRSKNRDLPKFRPLAWLKARRS